MLHPVVLLMSEAVERFPACPLPAFAPPHPSRPAWLAPPQLAHVSKLAIFQIRYGAPATHLFLDLEYGADRRSCGRRRVPPRSTDRAGTRPSCAASRSNAG